MPSDKRKKQGKKTARPYVKTGLGASGSTCQTSGEALSAPSISAHTDVIKKSSPKREQLRESTKKFVHRTVSCTEEKIILMTSVGSACINILATLASMILIDCGAINGSYSELDIDERYKTHEFITKATELKPCSQHYTNQHAREKRTQWLNNEMRDQIIRASIRDYLRKVFASLPNCFRTIIITSSDSDCWNFLHLLLLDDNNTEPLFTVESFIFHGHPASYSTSFHSLVEDLRRVYKDAEFYFTAWDRPLESRLSLKSYLNDKDRPLVSKVYYTPQGYVMWGNKPHTPSFQKFLSLSSNAYVTIPFMNGHFEPWYPDKWRVPSQTLPNKDCCPVLVHVYDFKVLFLADLTCEAQFDLKDWFDNMHRLYNYGKIDILYLSHNSSLDSLCNDFILEVRPRVFICPIFQCKGYPSQELMNYLQSLDFIAESDKKHSFFYYCREEDIVINERSVPSYGKYETATGKFLYSIDYPLTLAFSSVSNTCSIYQSVVAPEIK